MEPNMITYYQTLHYGKGAIIKTDMELSGRGIKKTAQGKYTTTNSALAKLSKTHKIINQDGQIINGSINEKGRK